jgi:hypothetical protein
MSGDKQEARRAASARLDRLSKEATAAEREIDDLGDEVLADAERRKARLAADLTDPLPDDSPEPR